MAIKTKSIWVTRWDYQKPEDLLAILMNCANFGFNQVLFQVRGNATAYYKSKYEPWAWELTGKTVKSLGKDPGWDPLQTAIEIAKEEKLELHAYMNVYPGWRGKLPPPSNVKHVFNTHRNWFGKNEAGDYQALTDEYITLCPGIPAVRDYLEKIYLQVVKDYAIDGIHLDYVRYYNDVGEYSLDPISVKLFQAKYKCHPVEKPEEWNRYKRESVSDLVRRIYHGTKKINKKCKVSASIWNSYYNGYSRFYQDSWGWMKEGILDFVNPMNYTVNTELFKHWTLMHKKHSCGIPVNPGIGLLWDEKKAKRPYFSEQLKACQQMGLNGLTVFAYQSLFPKNKPNQHAKTFVKIIK